MSPTAQQKKWSPISSLQGSLFIKICDYIMGNEEPAYQALPRSVLSNHNLANIQKQKYIGTWKHNSEAVEGMKQEHRIKDSDGSSGHFSENIQGTTLSSNWWRQQECRTV